jgi:hypothetical protein
MLNLLFANATTASDNSNSSTMQSAGQEDTSNDLNDATSEHAGIVGENHFDHAGNNSSSSSSSSHDTGNRAEEFESSIVHPKLCTEESAKAGDDGGMPPEGLGACFFTYACSYRQKSCRLDLLRPFLNFCQSTVFSDFVWDCGVGAVGFTPNEHLVDGNPVYDKFRTLLMAKQPGPGRMGRGDQILNSACLSVVFHGTSEHNIRFILKDGLDPKKRSGQAYGPGEYFSKNPMISVPYCKGDTSMVVFLVVVPPKEDQHKDLPNDYVVVKKNAHQLPLGVLTFDMTDRQALREAHAMRWRLKQLNADYGERQADAMEAQTKAYIIQLLIQEKTDLAIEKYEKYRNVLKQGSLREISMYVHQKFDADLASCLFPNLPVPFSVQEFNDRELTTVEAHEKKAQEAKDKLADARKDVAHKSFKGKHLKSRQT